MTRSAAAVRPDTMAGARNAFFDALPEHFENVRLGPEELERLWCAAASPAWLRRSGGHRRGPHR